MHALIDHMRITAVGLDSSKIFLGLKALRTLIDYRLYSIQGISFPGDVMMKNLKKIIMLLSLSFFSSILFAADVVLYDTTGAPAVYVDPDNQSMLYLSSGQPVGYIYDNGIVYSFDGKHLGWYSDGVLWDKNGYMLAFGQNKAPSTVTLQTVTPSNTIVKKTDGVAIGTTREPVKTTPVYIYQPSPTNVKTYFGY